MAIKGQASKDALIQELLNYFGDRAFQYDKEIRVNMMEDGQLTQIKLTLTAAKVMVNAGGDAAMPGDTVEEVAAAPVQANLDASKAANIETSATEKENLSKLLRSLGL